MCCSGLTISHRTEIPSCFVHFSRATRQAVSPKCCCRPVKTPSRRFRRSSRRFNPQPGPCPPGRPFHPVKVCRTARWCSRRFVGRKLGGKPRPRLLRGCLGQIVWRRLSVSRITALGAIAVGFGVARPHLAAHSAAPSRAPAIIASAKPGAAALPVQTALVPTVKTAGAAALRGEWRIDEENLQVGRMVWSADAVLAGDGTIVFDAHKESIAGQPATLCERETNLQAVFAPGVGRQIAPFREVNCEGTTSSGEVHVTSFSPDNRSFYGSFWEDGARVGDFIASKR